METREEEEEISEFECSECGEELDVEDACSNPECSMCGCEATPIMSDWQERQHERKQMGVGG